MAFRLGEIAERLGGRLQGDPELTIRGLKTLEQAGSGDLSFLLEARYRAAAEASGAAAFLVPRDTVDFAPPHILVKDPKAALAAAVRLFFPLRRPAPGIHPTAVVEAGCELGHDVHVGPYAVLGAGSRIGEGVVIHAHVVVGQDCRIGDDVVLHPHVVLYAGTVLGERTEVHAGAVLGADGFGYASDASGHHKVPHVGQTVLEADVEVGALAAIDRAVLGSTWIGSGTKIDNLVQVGHNSRVGRHCILCGQVGLAGSSQLGDHVVMGGQSGAAGHFPIGAGVQVAGKSAVFQEVPAGRKVGGIPAIDLAKWKRRAALLGRLPEILRRLRRLERRLAEPADERSEGKA